MSGVFMRMTKLSIPSQSQVMGLLNIWEVGIVFEQISEKLVLLCLWGPVHVHIAVFFSSQML